MCVTSLYFEVSLFSLLVWIVLVVIFPTKLVPPLSEFVCKRYRVSVLKVLPIVLYREVKSFPMWFYLPLLDNDVSLHILVVLVVVISTSPRTSKTESVCKSYGGFRIGLFPVGINPGNPDLIRLERETVSYQSDLIRIPDLIRKFRILSDMVVSGPKNCITVTFLGTYLRGLLPHKPQVFQARFSPLSSTIVDLGKLAPSQSLP